MRKSSACPYCGSNAVSYQVVNEVKKQGAGCMTWIICIILAFTVIGLILVLPLILGKSKNSNKTIAVCQHCGSRWQL